ncbi:MAG: glycosyltransferase, partial [Tannerella sp.]|nr:glycosyltransferase [Tannerella sp.]
MKTIVVSAVNLRIGGTLQILRGCLQHLSALAETGNYRIVALVYQKDLASFPHIEYIEMKWPKKNWLFRLWCEYVTMKKISSKLSPVYMWLSLHDTTPNVLAEKRAVYCQNSFPYYKWRAREWLFAPKIVLFALFTNHIYRKNIRKNNYIIVQQEWMKTSFIRLFGLKDESIIIAYPPKPVSTAQTAELADHQRPPTLSMNENSISKTYSFLFPAAPDSHKNFECICQAAMILNNRMNINNFKVFLTVKGDENKYTKWLNRKYGNRIPNIVFTGYLDKKTLYAYYQSIDCMIFSSKVESWGLPITEFAEYNKPMLLVDLPYAHETAGGYDKVAFFNPDDPQQLAGQMRQLVEGDDSFLMTVPKHPIPSPLARS